MRCPLCDEEFDPVDAIMDAEWREILVDVMPTFAGHGKIAFEYVEKFGTNPVKLKSRKILRLMKELSKLFTSGRFSYQKKVYVISQAGVLEAFGIVNNKNFGNPLENHNYLKKVMMQISDRELKEKRVGLDRDLRKRETGIRRQTTDDGERKPEEDEISIGEFARQADVDVAALAGMISGSFVVETIFFVPGLGRFFVNAAFNRDYTMVMGTVLFYATLIIVLNLVVDIAYVVINPRARVDNG